jgi:tetratricopeptide (TPR) repeat protein
MPCQRVSFLVVTLLLATVYWPVVGFGFLDWDDGVYVTANPLVLAGLTAGGVAEACTSFSCSNWHPLTLVSHMLDVSLFGSWAGGHHLTNVGLHTVNALLVFALAWRLTARRPESFVVATLFAIHPQRVESVAWIAERKDLLCGLLFLVSLLAYLRFTTAAELRSRGLWYAAALGTGILACLAKPMAVTLPLLLLSLDGWQGRVARGAGLRILGEKIPFVAMAGLTAVLTILAQEGAKASVEAVPTDMRIANAVVGYATYVRRAVWPTGLAAMYPHAAKRANFEVVAGTPFPAAAPGLPAVQLVSAVALLAIITGAAVALARDRAGRGMPWLAFGWAWFVVMLVPVIGLVQVGSQATADRYYYLPGIGLEFGLVMTVGELLRRAAAGRESLPRPLAVTASGIGLTVILILAVLAHRQVLTWRSDESLWRHAVAVVPQNAIAESLLASALAAQGRTMEAVEHHVAALRIDPTLHDSLTNLGLLLSDGGRPADALPLFERASVLRPNDGDTLVNRAICLARLGQTDEASTAFLRALSIEPDNARHRYNFALLLEASGDRTAALQQLEAALVSDPDFAPARAARLRILAGTSASPTAAPPD